MNRTILLLVLSSLTGCGTISGYVEEHPQVVAVAGVAVLTAGGILYARNLAHTNHVQVVQQPRTQLGAL